MEKNEKYLLITIGPQCSGKTSYLKYEINNEIKDINMDNIEQTYQQINIEKILENIFYEDISLNKNKNIKIGNLYFEERIEQLSDNETLGLILYFTEVIYFFYYDFLMINLMIN